MTGGPEKGGRMDLVYRSTGYDASYWSYDVQKTTQDSERVFSLEKCYRYNLS